MFEQIFRSIYEKAMAKSSIAVVCFIWTSNVSIFLRGTQKTLHLYDFRISGRVPEPPKPIGDPKTAQLVQEKQNPFWEILFMKYQISEFVAFKTLWKRQAPEIPGDLSDKILRI